LTNRSLNRRLGDGNSGKRTEAPETIPGIVRVYAVECFPFAGVDNMTEVAVAIRERADVFAVAPRRHACHCDFGSKHVMNL
jgi:hypothetical protein